MEVIYAVNYEKQRCDNFDYVCNKCLHFYIFQNANNLSIYKTKERTCHGSTRSTTFFLSFEYRKFRLIRKFLGEMLRCVSSFYLQSWLSAWIDLSKKTPNLSCESMKCIPKIICQYYVLYKYTFCGTLWHLLSSINVVCGITKGGHMIEHMQHILLLRLLLKCMHLPRPRPPRCSTSLFCFF